MTSLIQNELSSSDYQPRPAPYFDPHTIVITKGAIQNTARRNFVEAICAAYPTATVIQQPNTPHNRVRLDGPDPVGLHYQGKKTLVLAVHNSAVRYSDEDGNTCPNYWHFSPYGFCPYDCRYCYLAGTLGVKYSPTVKIFVNLPEILNHVGKVTSGSAEPIAFYLGKLQDALALDPLTGYSRIMVPFFAGQEHARLVLLTKSANVENLLDLDHKKHTILSWSLNPPKLSDVFEKNLPAPDERVAAMRKCAHAGYPVRAVIMPIIPIEGWRNIYSKFLQTLLESTPLNRVTLGQICSYSSALKLTELKLGRKNPISSRLEKAKSDDGRIRFPVELRIEVYRYLIDTIRRLTPRLQIGLCMEERRVFEALNMQTEIGRCNCVL